MEYFTLENTRGVRQHEVNLINRVAERLEQEYKLDLINIIEGVSSTYFRGIKESQLFDTIVLYLGLDNAEQRNRQNSQQNRDSLLSSGNDFAGSEITDAARDHI